MADFLDDPAVMTPSQRRREIATILAKGVLRLRQCRMNSPVSQPSCTAGICQNDSESHRDYLDERAKTSPHVPVVNERENVKEFES